MDAGRYKPYIANRGPSVNLWRDFDFAAIASDPGMGNHWFDDLTGVPYVSVDSSSADVTSTIGGINYFVDGTTTGNQQLDFNPGGTIDTTTQNKSVLGYVSIDSAGTAVDNEQTGLMWGMPVILDARTRLAAIEFRIKATVLATYDMFIGWYKSATTLTTGIPIASDATIATTNGFLGFHKVAATGVMNVKYNVGGGTTTAGPTTAATLVASTWTKIGIRFDRNAKNTQTISYWQDGVPLSSYTSAALAAAAAFPTTTVLSPCIALRASETTDYGIFTCDWVRVAQMF